MSNLGTVYIGTSGWSYQHWRGPFYPPDLPQTRWLDYYVKHFSTVEINNSFYQLPHEATFAEWQHTTPNGFLFAVKASRYITHMKKLRDVQAPLDMFLAHATALGNKLGPILFQLPPRWNFNAERLSTFLKMLPRQHRFAFEFRDATWFNEQAYALLRQHQAAFCIYELAGKQSPEIVTADFIYIRLHGPAGAYQGQYTQSVLHTWAERIAGWRKAQKDVYCYFDNDQAGYAVQDAQRLRELVVGAGGREQGAR